jgi:cytochrome P450
MNAISDAPLRWDPYDPQLVRDPYPTYRRLREEQPLYYNEEYDFYAVSRFEDVERGLADRDTFISGKGGILEFIKSGMQVPPGVFIFEDPPLHTMHRGILTRVFTPKKMTALEPLIRQYCADALDPLVEEGVFDFIEHLGGQMPMRVIGMLLGIPEEDQQEVRARADAALRTEPGKPQDLTNHSFVGQAFDEYLDWRIKHPSDDLMTELLNAEFVDEKGVTRTLTREEILIFCNILAGAGNETTNRLIGWTGKVLAEHPDQRRQIVEDRSLINPAIEEILRFEPPGPFIARYVAKDVELYGTKVPAGSAMVFLAASANRDERRFQNGDAFDIHRERIPHLTFGHGFHVCLGNALARVEGRVALDEILKRFPEWDVDLENAHLSSTSTVRGWETLPAFTPKGRGKARKAQAPAEAAAPAAVPGAETWKLSLKTPMGPQEMTAQLVRQGDTVTGRIDSPMGGEAISEGKASGDKLSWIMQLTKPAAVKLSFEVKVAGDQMSGKVKFGMFGSGELSGRRA